MECFHIIQRDYVTLWHSHQNMQNKPKKKGQQCLSTTSIHNQVKICKHLFSDQLGGNRDRVSVWTFFPFCVFPIYNWYSFSSQGTFISPELARLLIQDRPVFHAWGSTFSWPEWRMLGNVFVTRLSHTVLYIPRRICGSLEIFVRIFPPFSPCEPSVVWQKTYNFQETLYNRNIHSIKFLHQPYWL